MEFPSFSPFNHQLFNLTVKPINIVFKASENSEDAGGSILLSNGTVIELFGSNIQSIWDILESLNLSFTAHFKDWGAAIQLVSNGTYDWGAPLMSLTEGLVHEGLSGGDGLVFLLPLVSMTSNVYFRQPPAETVYVTMLRPFQVKVWVVFLVSIFTCAILACKEHPRKMYCCKWQWNWNHRIHMNFAYIIIEMIQFLRGRYSYRDISKLSVPTKKQLTIRNTAPFYKYQYFPILVGSFLGLFFVSIYTAQIAATFANTDSVIKTSNDLLKWKYSITSWNYAHFERIFNNPGLALKLESKFTGSKNAVKRVVRPSSPDSRFAFLTHSDGFYQYNRFFSRELCRVSSIASKTKVAQAMFLRKGSLYRESINLKIVQLIENGLNYRYQLIYKRKFEYLCISEDLGFTQLTYNHVSLAFIVLLTGATVALLIEVFLYLRSIFKKRSIFLYDIR